MKMVVLLRIIPSCALVLLWHVSTSVGFFVVSPPSSSLRQAVGSLAAAAAQAKNSSDIAHDNVDDYRNRMGVLRSGTDDDNSKRQPVRSFLASHQAGKTSLWLWPCSCSTKVLADDALTKLLALSYLLAQKIDVVMKFGGSSLADETRIEHVAQLIKDQNDVYNIRPRAVVCSAMGKTTNNLLSAGDFALGRCIYIS
jgi:Amino acid kinase family